MVGNLNSKLSVFSTLQSVLFWQTVLYYLLQKFIKLDTSFAKNALKTILFILSTYFWQYLSLEQQTLVSQCVFTELDWSSEFC